MKKHILALFFLLLVVAACAPNQIADEQKAMEKEPTKAAEPITETAAESEIEKELDEALAQLEVEEIESSLS